MAVLINQMKDFWCGSSRQDVKIQLEDGSVVHPSSFTSLAGDSAYEHHDIIRIDTDEFPLTDQFLRKALGAKEDEEVVCTRLYNGDAYFGGAYYLIFVKYQTRRKEYDKQKAVRAIQRMKLRGKRGSVSRGVGCLPGQNVFVNLLLANFESSKWSNKNPMFGSADRSQISDFEMYSTSERCILCSKEEYDGHNNIRKPDFMDKLKALAKKNPKAQETVE